MLKPEHIKRITRNRGGIRRIDLLFDKDILQLPAADNTSLYLTGNLSLKAGTQAYALYFTKTSLRFQETADISSPQGDLYKLELSGNIPKDRPLSRLLRLRLRNERATLFFQDWNNYWHIYRHMRARPSTSSGSFGGYNGMNLRFSGQQSSPAGFWEFIPGIISTYPQTCPDSQPAAFAIGDPGSGQMIGDPDADQVIGFFN